MIDVIISMMVMCNANAITKHDNTRSGLPSAPLDMEWQQHNRVIAIALNIQDTMLLNHNHVLDGSLHINQSALHLQHSSQLCTSTFLLLNLSFLKGSNSHFCYFKGDTFVFGSSFYVVIKIVVVIVIIIIML